MDDCALLQRFALGEPLRWAADGVMGFECCLQVAFHTRTLTLGQVGRVLETVPRSLGQSDQGAAPLSKLLFGLAYQRHEDFALPAALATTAAHDLREVVVERVRLGLQRGRLRGTVGRDGLDEGEDFFCAL